LLAFFVVLKDAFYHKSPLTPAAFALYDQSDGLVDGMDGRISATLQCNALNWQFVFDAKKRQNTAPLSII